MDVLAGRVVVLDHTGEDLACQWTHNVLLSSRDSRYIDGI